MTKFAVLTKSWIDKKKTVVLGVGDSPATAWEDACKAHQVRSQDVQDLDSGRD